MFRTLAEVRELGESMARVGGGLAAGVSPERVASHFPQVVLGPGAMPPRSK
jgi:hypothetical protein